MFEIAQTAKGRLWIMPCPSSGGLQGAVAHYRAQGADHIVSMLAKDEASLLGLAGEADACAAAGLGFTQAPIVDFGLPDIVDFTRLVGQVNDLLLAGAGVAVHCRAGIGRSGMVTSGVLVAQGLSAQTAMAQVAQARGVPIPDTVEQATFVKSFAAVGLTKK